MYRCVILLLLLVVPLLACSNSKLDEVKTAVRDGYPPTVLELRAGCLALKGVDYRYGKLDEELPLATLEAGAYQDIRYEGDVENVRFNCERYWSNQSDDVVLRHFTDVARASIIASCREWLRISPPASWKAFRNAMRFEPYAEYALRFPPGERARLRKLGIGHTRTDQVYRAFDKNEARIATFCEAAAELR